MWAEEDKKEGKNQFSVVSSSLSPYGLQPARLLCPWNSPGKNTGVGCHFLPQGIFQTQGLNAGLLHCRQFLYHLSHQGSRGRQTQEQFKEQHQTSARTWCTGKTQRERVEREVGVGIGMGNTCKPMAVSFQCMTKSTTNKNNNNKKIKRRKLKKKKRKKQHQGILPTAHWLPKLVLSALTSAQNSR